MTWQCDSCQLYRECRPAVIVLVPPCYMAMCNLAQTHTAWCRPSEIAGVRRDYQVVEAREVGLLQNRQSHYKHI
eukprot:scaffold1042_cov401-Prasinococcus_capsulatus_cf.AAC.58